MVWLKYSAARWVELPRPADANGISPGFALAALTRSPIDLYGPSGAVTITYGVVPRMFTSIRLLSGS